MAHSQLVGALIMDKPDPITALGVHCIGEIGITGVAAAIANAFHHATGRRLRSLPITLDKLIQRFHAGAFPLQTLAPGVGESPGSTSVQFILDIRADHRFEVPVSAKAEGIGARRIPCTRPTSDEALDGGIRQP